MYIALLLSSYMYVYIVTRIVTTTALCGIPRCVGAFVGYEANASPRQTGCMPYHMCSGTCLCVMQCSPQWSQHMPVSLGPDSPVQGSHSNCMMMVTPCWPTGTSSLRQVHGHAEE